MHASMCACCAHRCMLLFFCDMSPLKNQQQKTTQFILNVSNRNELMCFSLITLGSHIRVGGVFSLFLLYLPQNNLGIGVMYEKSMFFPVN